AEAWSGRRRGVCGPASAGLERSLARAPIREVVTSVEIAAPPEKVWPHVQGFADLPPPAEWFFRTGIAYPVRARISGTGVGAVRRCEFSTGPFVEPITVWDPRSEEHTSELQSRVDLVCRLLL